MTHRKQTKTVFFIQAHHRCYKAYSYYKRLESLEKAALYTQCCWRRRVAKKQLRMLKMQARDVGGYIPHWKDELQKRLEVLTWFSHLEKRIRVDLEKANAQDTAKLEEALRMTQIRLDEANGQVIEELLKHHQLRRRRTNSNN